MISVQAGPGTLKDLDAEGLALGIESFRFMNHRYCIVVDIMGWRSYDLATCILTIPSSLQFFPQLLLLASLDSGRKEA